MSPVKKEVQLGSVCTGPCFPCFPYNCFVKGWDVWTEEMQNKLEEDSKEEAFKHHSMNYGWDSVVAHSKMMMIVRS